MRIGFDAKRLFHNNTGLGHYARTLLKDISQFESSHDLVLFASKIVKSHYHHFFEEGFKSVDFRYFGNVKRVMGFGRFLEKEKIDIFHGLSNELPLNIHRLNIPSVVTIHDVIFKVIPETYSSFDRAIYNYKTKFACNNADVIVAISESTKRDIIKYYDIDKNKIRVIYQTCHERYKNSLENFTPIKNNRGLPSDYFIQVGSINERKNLLNTLKALALISKIERPNLVIVGRGKGSYFDAVNDFIQKKNLQENVYIYDDVEDEELPYLYHQAKCSIYISNYEGFGIPVIESLYCGTSVITSNVSSMPEAVGPCGLLVDPSNIDQIKNALVNPPQFDEKICQEFLVRYNSQQIVGQWISLYQELAR